MLFDSTKIMKILFSCAVTTIDGKKSTSLMCNWQSLCLTKPVFNTYISLGVHDNRMGIFKDTVIYMKFVHLRWDCIHTRSNWTEHSSFSVLILSLKFVKFFYCQYLSVLVLCLNIMWYVRYKLNINCVNYLSVIVSYVWM